MKVDEIRQLDDAALSEEIKKAEIDIMRLRMENAVGGNDNPLAIRYRKKDVARMKTILRQRNEEGR